MKRLSLAVILAAVLLTFTKWSPIRPGAALRPTQPPNALPNEPLAANRIVRFAGLTWGVREGSGSPGPNLWSASDASARVDADGRLHLKIKQYEGKWYSAEVFTVLPTTFGEHRFEVLKEHPTLDQLDPNVVAGLFLYPTGCGDPCTGELDIEFTRDGQPDRAENAQYVVQPHTEPGNLFRFPMLPFGPLSEHVIDWQPTWVRFKSYTQPGSAPPTQSWLYQGAHIPHPRDRVVVILELWLRNGLPPTNGLEDEIIVTDASFPGVCRPTDAISAGQTVAGSTLDPRARDQIASYPDLDWDETGPEIAYRLTPAADGPIRLALDSGDQDLDLFVMTAGNGDCFTENILAHGNQVAQFAAQAGQTYFVVVDGYRGAQGDFRLTVDHGNAGAPPVDPAKPSWFFFPQVLR